MDRSFQFIYAPDGKKRIAFFESPDGWRFCQEWLRAEGGTATWHTPDGREASPPFPSVQSAVNDAQDHIPWLKRVLVSNAIMPVEWYTPLNNAHILALVTLREDCLQTGELVLTFRSYPENSEAATDIVFTWSDYAHYEVTLEELSPLWQDWGTHSFSNCSNRTHILDKSPTLDRLQGTGLLVHGSTEYVIVTSDEYITIVSHVQPAIQAIGAVSEGPS